MRSLARRSRAGGAAAGSGGARAETVFASSGTFCWRGKMHAASRLAAACTSGGSACTCPVGLHQAVLAPADGAIATESCGLGRLACRSARFALCSSTTMVDPRTIATSPSHPACPLPSDASTPSAASTTDFAFRRSTGVALARNHASARRLDFLDFSRSRLLDATTADVPDIR